MGYRVKTKIMLGELPHRAARLARFADFSFRPIPILGACSQAILCSKVAYFVLLCSMVAYFVSVLIRDHSPVINTDY